MSQYKDNTRLFCPLKTKLLNKLQHTETCFLSFLKIFSPFMHHVELTRNSRFTTRKRGLSRHLAMHHFHAITSIILLFHESHPENSANHAITPTDRGASMSNIKYTWKGKKSLIIVQIQLLIFQSVYPPMVVQSETELKFQTSLIIILQQLQKKQK